MGDDLPLKTACVRLLLSFPARELFEKSSLDSQKLFMHLARCESAGRSSQMTDKVGRLAGMV